MEVSDEYATQFLLKMPIHPDLIKIFEEQCGHKICKRCKCCDLVFQECENCDEDGFTGHDCGEDTCCCLYPEENIVCDICHGEGGWLMCLGRCDENGVHQPKEASTAGIIAARKASQRGEKGDGK